MRYRFLTDKELQELEPEFKQFLISNHLYNEEWAELNQKNPEKAKEVVGVFSDLVLDKALTEMQFLVHVASDKVKVFWFQSEKAWMVGLDYIGNSKVLDYTNFIEVIQKEPESFKSYEATKAYEKELRNKEAFDLLELGAKPCDEIVFKLLSDLNKS